MAEPNESFFTATNLGVVEESLFIDDSLFWTFDGFNSFFDQDIFSFEIGDTGKSNNFISVETFSSNINIGLAIYDEEENLIVFSDNNEINYEEISLEDLPAGSYYIQVYDSSNYEFLSAGVEVFYTLTIDAPEAGNEAPVVEDDSLIIEENSLKDDLIGTISFSDPDGDFLTLALVGVVGSDLDPDGDGNVVVSFNQEGEIFVNDPDDLIPGLVFELEATATDSAGNSSTGTITIEIEDDGGGGSDDPIQDLEPNGDYFLGQFVNLGQLEGLNSGEGSINLFDDFQDLYQFELTDFAQFGNFIEIEFDSFFDGNLDLALYYVDPLFGPIYQAGSFNSFSDTETIDLSFYSAGNYLVQVYSADFFNENDVAYELTISLPGVVSGGGDAFETNDFIDEAAELDLEPGTNTFQAQLTNYYDPDSVFFGYVYDDDWFSFELDETGKLGNSLAIDYDDSLGTLYLDLYDRNGFYIDSGFSFLGEASISLWGLEAGTYYVNVYGWDINPIDYNLTIDAPSEGGGGEEDAYEANDTFETARDLGTLEGNFNLEDDAEGQAIVSVEKGDVDWFTFTTTGESKGGDKITVNYDAEVGIVGLELYDANGFFLDFGFDDDYDGDASISLQGLDAGTYSVLVYGFGFEDLEYNLSFQTPSDGGTPDDDDDRYEQNDSFDAAKDLNPAVNENPKLTGLNTYEDLKIVSNDDDWFSFTTDAGNVTVRIDFEHSKGDLDLELYDADNNLIRSSDGINNVEDITENLAAGTYYVKVLGFLGASNDDYTLTIQTPGNQTGGNANDDSYEENDTDQQLIGTPDARANLKEIQGTRVFDNLALLDDDWFSFKLAKAGQQGNFVKVDFDDDKGDLDLQLFYDANDDGKGLELVDESSSVTDTEKISLANLEKEGTYYLRVFGYAGATNNNYKLTIDAPKISSGLQPDIFEVNDTPEQATELRQASELQRLNLHVAEDRDWFKFDLLDDPGLRDRATIEFANASGNIDLFLYTLKDGVDAPASVDDLVLLRTSQGNGDTEAISLYGLTPDKYYLQVVGNNNTNPDYTLKVTGTIGIDDDGGTTNPGVREDSFEPNDTQAAASALGTIKGSRTVGTEDAPLTIHQVQAGNPDLNQLAVSDEDWFKFTTQFDGTVEVKIEFDNDKGNLDLEFLDADGNVVGKAQTNSDTESISLENLAAGQYFIRVTALTAPDQFGTATTNTYKLEIETPAGETILPDALEENDTLETATVITRNITQFSDLTIDAGDEDWFKFTTGEVGTADNNVSISYDVAGKLDLKVKNADGEDITLDGPLPFDGYEQISFEGLAAGDYYLQVVGVEGATNREYTLDLNAPRSPEEIPDVPDDGTTAGDTWTILVYLASDNDLEEFALRDINEMESIQLPDNVNIVVQIDRAKGFDLSNGNWETTRRGRIQYDTDESIVNSSLEDIGETNTGDPATLQAFIEWGTQTYKADHYGVIIWNHGSGLGGTSYDDLSGSNLEIVEATQAFTNAKDSEGNPIELSLIGFDACLQGLVEQAYDIRNLTDVMVASQDLEPGNGWDYKAWLEKLAANPRVNAEELGAQIVDAYGEAYNNRQTLSAIRTGEGGALLDALKEAINGLTSALLADPSAENLDAITKARYASKAFYNGYNLDLGQFMDNIANSAASDAIKTAAAAVRTALDAVVIDRVDSLGANGLSIYVPQANSNQFDYYVANNFKFVADSQWNGFIEGLSGDTTRNIPTSDRITADYAETNDLAGNYIRTNNNNANDAYDLGRLISSGNNFTGLTLHEAGDVDWYKFELPVSPSGDSSEKLSLVFNSALGDLNAELYSVDDLTTPLVTGVAADNGKELSFADLPAAGQYFLKVSGVTATTTNPNYTISVDAPQARSQEVDNGDWAERNDMFDQATNLGTIRQNEELRFPGLSMNSSDAVFEQSEDPDKQALLESDFTDDAFDPDLLAQGKKVFKDSSFLKNREVGDWFVIEPIKATDLNPNTVTINFDSANGGRDLNLFLFREAENGQLEFFGSSLDITHGETESQVSESVSFPEQNNPIYVYVEGNIVPNYEIVVARRQIDLDGNGVVNAFTDGRILLGALQNQDAETLASYTGDGSSRTFGDELSNYLQVARTTLLDVDGNGLADADTDGNIILGYLFNYDPDELAKLVGQNATRTTGAQIKQFLDQFFPATKPPSADSDAGDSVATSNTVAVESGKSLFGDDADNRLTGGAGDDLIVGGAGNDTLVGNEGDDSLYGGSGDDILNGGAGADKLVFGDNNGNDTVKDFVVAEDLIQVNASVGFSDSNALLAALSNNGKSSVLTLSDGNTVTIFSDETLTAANFLVV
jgi:hypothetical protein